MHLPDGFISNQISLGFIALASGFLVSSFSKLRSGLTKKVIVVKNELALAHGQSQELLGGEKLILSKSGKEKIQQMFFLGVLIFTFQLIDFPVLNSSGHLLGGFLAAVVLGPYLGLLVISLVLIFQALFLADGGLVALGLNIFNIGIVTCFTGYYFYYLINKLNKLNGGLKFFVLGMAAWLSVVVASIFYVLEVGLFSNGGFSLGLIKIHLFIGLFEALVTILIIHWLKFKLFKE